MRARRVLPAACAVLVASTLIVLGADRAAATKDLQDGIGAKDPAKIKKACEDLVQAGGKESLDVLLKFAEKMDDRGIYFQLTGAIAGFDAAPDLDELGSYMIAHQKDKATVGLVRDLLFRLQNNPSPNVAVPLAKVLKEGIYDLQLMAVDQLAKCRSADCVDALIEGLKKEDKGDPQLRARLVAALVAICGQDKGDIANWEGWWKEQKPKGVPEASGGATGSTGPREQEKTTTISKQKKKNVIVLAADSPEDKAEPNDFDYDHVQDILEKHGYPHKVLKRATFEKNPDKYLMDAYALLINCHYIIKTCRCPDCYGGNGPMTNRRIAMCNPQCQKHIWGSYALSKATLDKIKKWVEEGGFLYTEDWGLVETTGVLWPDKIGMVGQSAPDPETHEAIKWAKTIRQPIMGRDGKPAGFIPSFGVHISPGKGNTTHPLMRGVWDVPKPPVQQPKVDDPNAGKTGTREEHPADPLSRRWTIEDDSPIIEIKDHEHVYVLIESEELTELTAGNIAVAVSFRVGPKEDRKVTLTGGPSRATGEWSRTSKGGRVLHTLSHYGHQNSAEDGEALDQLLLNFLIEAQKHWEANNAAK